MQGKRHDLIEGGSGFKAGEFGKANGVWYCCTPNLNLGNLSSHDVTEHEDGTITVSPSILVSDSDGERWHGYLERGIWREV